MHQVIITIDQEATTTVQVKGHAGPGCKALTKDIEAALGDTTKDQPTNELHHRATQKQTTTR